MMTIPSGSVSAKTLRSPFIFRGNADLNAPYVTQHRRHTQCNTARTRALPEDRCGIVGALSRNCIIMSGLAYGIDIAAHKAALANGLPTVAVLGHGLKTIYPSLHAGVAKSMLENGGHLTDFSSDTLPGKE